MTQDRRRDAVPVKHAPSKSLRNRHLGPTLRPDMTGDAPLNDWLLDALTLDGPHDTREPTNGLRMNRNALLDSYCGLACGRGGTEAV